MVDMGRMAETEARYRDRSERRALVSQALADGRPLDADEPERVAKRLARLAPRALVGGAESATSVLGADTVVLERLIGKNDLIGAAFLARGAVAARTVARIVIRSRPDLVEGFGTGSLVGPGLLLTNNHVLADPTSATHSEAEFDHQLASDGTLSPPVPFALQPDVFFATDEALDFTVVAVAPTAAAGRSLEEARCSGRCHEGQSILSSVLDCRRRLLLQQV